MGTKISNDLAGEYDIYGICHYAEPQVAELSFLEMRNQIYPMLEKVKDLFELMPDDKDLIKNEYNELIDVLYSLKAEVGILQTLGVDYPEI